MLPTYTLGAIDKLLILCLDPINKCSVLTIFRDNLFAESQHQQTFLPTNTPNCVVNRLYRLRIEVGQEWNLEEFHT